MSANPQSAVPPYPVIPHLPRKSWLGRNWKWLLAGVFLFFLLLGCGILALVFGAMRSSDVATESVLRAQSSPLVVQSLGSPIKEGWFVSGSINVTTDSGDADLSVPISGPKGAGRVYATAHKSAGVWSYSAMQVLVDGSSDRIDLLSGRSAENNSEAGQPTPAQTAQNTAPAQPQSTLVSQPADASAAPAIAAPTPDTPAPAAASDVIQSQDSNAPGTVAELTQCRRSEGVLSVKVRFRNTSGKTVEFAIFKGGNDGEREKAYVTATSKKYFILKDSSGAFLTSPSDYCGVCVRLEAGQAFTWWAKFPAPPAEVKKVNLMTPVTSPFEDVPITDK
jgi:hypothetical protein